MRNQYQLLMEKYEIITESLEAEKRTFDNPDDGLSIEISDEDPNTGTLHYMGYEFPLSKVQKGGGITYYVGSVATGKTYTVRDYTQFTKVIAGIDRGEVKPSTSTSSVFSKAKSSTEQELVPVYYPDQRNPGNLIKKMRIYMTNPQAEQFIYDMYQKHGNAIFLKGEEGKAHNPLYGYATDNANFRDEYSQYFDLTRWSSKMNLASHRGGHKSTNIIRGGSRE